MKLTDLSKVIPTCFPQAEERGLGEYAQLKYPRLLPLLKMKVRSYRLPGLGYLMCMDTSMMGLMRLSTFAVTPSDGLSVPFLLIDTMSMGKKRLAYAELYDCRKDRPPIEALQQLQEKYLQIEDYAEKPAWYVQERMQGSLIKCAPKEQEERLYDMVLDALQTYVAVAQQAGSDPENRIGLKAFSERMITEGNPSSGTLNTVLGEEKAVDFFRKVVMPV